MAQRYLLYTSVVFVVGVGIGFTLGRAGSNEAAGTLSSTDAQRLQKLEQQVAEAKKFLPQTPQDVRLVSGRIAEINDGVITLETLSVNPFEDLPRVRMVTVDGNTRIVRLVQKDPAQFQRESAAFQETLSRAGGVAPAPVLATPLPPSGPAVPPSPFHEEAIGRDDLRMGSQVTIAAAENIRDRQAFTATEIRLQELPAAPAPVPVPAR